MPTSPYQNSQLTEAPAFLKAELLSPVFIGSGHYLARHLDWIMQKGKILSLDADKLMSLLGPSRIEAFMNYVQFDLNQTGKKKSLKEFLANYGIRDLNSIVRQEMGSFSNIDPQLVGKKSKDLHQALRSGNGAPLLPGSSLKGSLRTAYAVHRMRMMGDKRPQANPEKLKNKEGAYQDSGLETALFTKPDVEKGKGPNFDLFRLVQLGDLHFKKTAAGPAPVVSFLEGKFDYRRDLATTLLEYLEPGQEAYTRLKVRQQLQQAPQGNFIEDEPLTPAHILTLAHEHTRSQLLNEIDFFQQHEDSLLEKVPELIPALEALERQSQGFDDHEFLLRVGAGSGFRGTTGGWHETYWEEPDYKRLAKQSRHGGPKGGENDLLPFPRSRKLGPRGEPLGYIKISLVPAEEYDGHHHDQASTLARAYEAPSPSAAEPEEDNQVLKYVAADKKIKAGDELHAEVTDGTTKPPTVKVYLQEGKTAQIPMSNYRNPDKGMRCLVEASEVAKKTKEVKMVRFKKPL